MKQMQNIQYLKVEDYKMEYYVQSLREEIFKHEERNKELKKELERQREWVANLLNSVEIAAKNFEDLQFIFEHTQKENTKQMQHNAKLSHYIYYLQDLLTENGIEFEIADMSCD